MAQMLITWISGEYHPVDKTLSLVDEWDHVWVTQNVQSLPNAQTLASLMGMENSGRKIIEKNVDLYNLDHPKIPRRVHKG